MTEPFAQVDATSLGSTLHLAQLYRMRRQLEPMVKGGAGCYANALNCVQECIDKQMTGLWAVRQLERFGGSGLVR